MRLNKVGVLAASILTAGFIAVGTSASAVITPPAPTKLSAAAIAPVGTVNGGSVIDESLTNLDVKNGSLSESDMYAPFVASMRTVFNNGVDSSAKIKDGVIAEVDLNQAVQDKLNKAGTGAAGKSAYELAVIAGFNGTQDQWLASLKGKDGKDAIVSVTALSNLTNRPDSGGHGNWATDTIVRNVAITKQGAVPASNCGAGATSCFFYTGSLTDTGTFVTIKDAKSPVAGTPINGVLSGTMSGGAKLEFYATSDAPSPSLVQGNVDGPGTDAAETTTARWAAQFFPAGVTVTDAKLNDWKWTYADSLCETHTQSLGGLTGDILGVNNCN
jgi:hypothetical protein